MGPWLFVAGSLLLWIAATKWLFPSDREQILSLLDALASRGSAQAGENPIASALVAKEIAESFTDSLAVTIHTDEGTEERSFSRRDISQKIAAIRVRFSPFSLAYLDPEISVEGNTAIAALTGRAVFERGDGSRALEQLRLRVELRRTKDGWRIAEVENSEPLPHDLAQRMPISESM